jgi:hypothetical protein
MGRLDDAREIVTRLRVITSVVIPDLSYLQNADADRRANPSQATGARKRGDKQLHRFRVLEVRIHSPPGESQRTFSSWTALRDAPGGLLRPDLRPARLREEGGRESGERIASPPLEQPATRGVCKDRPRSGGALSGGLAGCQTQARQVELTVPRGCEKAVRSARPEG